MKCFLHLFACIAVSVILFGNPISDQEFEELVRDFAMSGHPDHLFAIATSEHPRAIEVLLLAKEHRRPVDLIDQLGIEVDSEPRLSSFVSTPEQLELGLAIAGHRPSWEAFVSPVLGTDPCSSSSNAMAEREDFFTLVQRFNYDRIIRFLASLLYYDDERPKAYMLDSGCYNTSSAAAFALESMLGEHTPIGGNWEGRQRQKVRQMKEWWVENASAYGVEDPEAPFVLNLEQPPNESPTSSEAPDTGSTEDGAREDTAEEAETADSWLDENWLLIAVFLVAIAATVITLRLKRS